MDYTPKIKKEDLVHGEYYYGRCRNANIARWHEPLNRFIYWRTKFGQTFLEEICCPEDDKHFDVFVAEHIAGDPEKEIPFYKIPCYNNTAA